MVDLQARVSGLVATLCVCWALAGCAEGPLYRLGALNPWVRQRWAEEDRIVQSLPSRRAQLRDLAERASQLSPDEQQRVSEQVVALLRDDPVTILRVDAVHTLGALPTETAWQALLAAVSDRDPLVREIARTVARLRHCSRF